jgi:hypothetical protein
MGQPVWSWPNWRREAQPGMRVQHVYSGATGTFVKVSKAKHNGAVIRWDATELFPEREACLVSPAHDLKPIS